jgi:hypothetical protein
VNVYFSFSSLSESWKYVEKECSNFITIINAYYNDKLSLPQYTEYKNNTKEIESYLAIDDLVNGHRSIDITAITGLAARSCSRWGDTSCNIFAEIEFLLTQRIPFLSTLHIFINLQVLHITAILRAVLGLTQVKYQELVKNTSGAAL